MPFKFVRCEPLQWTGRYRRIPGRSSTLHVRWDDKVDLIWQDGVDTITCPAKMTRDLERLAEEINAVKRRSTGQAGGAFAINEYGQVITPVADGSWERYYVGDCVGEMVFIGPDDEEFTLLGDGALKCGDDWDLPYVGIPYNLSWDDKIHFKMTEGTDTEWQYPARQDGNLIRAIRSVRGSGRGVRFVVNPHGLVLTKRESGSFDWQAKYVGRINFECWFPKQNP